MTGEHMRVGTIVGRYNAIVREAKARERLHQLKTAASVCFWLSCFVVLAVVWVSMVGTR